MYVGRGCTHNCSYCGGSKAAHELIAARQEVALRSVDSIVASICDLERFGFDSACLALDSFPVAHADEYYVPIFDKLKQRNVHLDIEVERYFLPTPQFIESFSGLPGKKSFVTLSPHTQNQQLRERNGLHRYSNEALGELPGSDGAGSGVSCCPAQYELEPARKTFADYYRYHSLPAQNHWLEMGYKRQGCPGKDEVTRFFCGNFCERFKLGWASPIMCDVLAFMWKMRAFQTLDKVLPLKSAD